MFCHLHILQHFSWAASLWSCSTAHGKLLIKNVPPKNDDKFVCNDGKLIWHMECNFNMFFDWETTILPWQIHTFWHQINRTIQHLLAAAHSSSRNQTAATSFSLLLLLSLNLPLLPFYFLVLTAEDLLWTELLLLFLSINQCYCCSLSLSLSLSHS